MKETREEREGSSERDWIARETGEKGDKRREREEF